MSSRSPSHRIATQHFDERYKVKQIESFLRQPEHKIWASRSRTLRTQYLYLSCCFVSFFLKAAYDSCNLQRLLPVAKFLFMSSFIHTNIVFLFRQIPTETVIFINVCYQMKCFSGDSFSIF